jgi:hypothetical protein
VVRLGLPGRRARLHVRPSCRRVEHARVACPQTCGLLAPALAASTAAGTQVSVGTGHDGSVRCACETAVRVLGLSGRQASAADTCHSPVQAGTGRSPEQGVDRRSLAVDRPRAPRRLRQSWAAAPRPGLLGGQPTGRRPLAGHRVASGHRRAGGRLRVDQPCSRCRPGRRVACLSDPPGTAAPGALGRGGRSPASYVSIPSDCGTAGCSEAGLTTSGRPVGIVGVIERRRGSCPAPD